MQLMYERSEVVRVHHSRVAGPWRIRVGIVVPSAVGDRSIVLAKRSDLIGPISAIAQRSMNKDHRHARALIHIVQCDVVSDAGRTDLWLSSVFLRNAAGHDDRKDCSEDQNARIDATGSWHFASSRIQCKPPWLSAQHRRSARARPNLEPKASRQQSASWQSPPRVQPRLRERFKKLVDASWVPTKARLVGMRSLFPFCPSMLSNLRLSSGICRPPITSA